MPPSVARTVRRAVSSARCAADSASGAIAFATEFATAIFTRLTHGDVPVMPAAMMDLEPRRMMAATPLPISTSLNGLGTELRINGTAGHDVISIERTTEGLKIKNATGWSTTWKGSAATIRINGLDGNDRITVSSNISTPVALFGNAGNDTLVGGSGHDRLYGGAGTDVSSGGGGNDVMVSVGDGFSDKSTGGAGLDSYWSDLASVDSVTDLSAEESTIGAVHNIAKFARSTGMGMKSSDMDKFIDPTLTSGATKYTNFGSQPLFSKYGPRLEDITQGQLGDCYFLASLASLAKTDANIIRQSVADLGDGTYLVQFTSGPTKSFFRVDADLPTTSGGYLAYAQLGAQNSLWVAVMEKAYAFYRTGAASYGSIEGGFMGEVYEDIGLPTNAIFSAENGVSLLQQLKSQLDGGNAVTFATSDSVPNGAPVVTCHAYMVDTVTTDSEGNVTGLRLKNPWGIDGAGNDGKNDGYVTLSPAQAMSTFWFACTAQV